ncbi:lysophospholipid acyltransferase family protein [Sediminibacterium soli]|uniref:lysophospholipid acyltransferase family protein n=1 Tax=Sediminibacterium soli TaxID=2698829 RepID=UPI00137956BC|nr:lysophospholipid acyltransferase family protein [Sediminibacterium soli]NCI46454.1 1-acyl-sn-glycerol-3-phosphate acyltransferase [Sediminibacterium soli]
MNRTRNQWLLNIVCRVWALWALLLFLGTMLVAFVFYLPCFFLKDPAKAAWHRQVSRVWMLLYLHLIGCPFSVKGREHFSASTNYIVVCNHNSLMDVPISTPFMPRPNKTIAKKSFARVPVFGWIYSFGSVLVDRNSDGSRRKSIDDMKQVLALGIDMVIYPEGTRNRTGDPLKKFYDGAFRLSVDTQKPVMPVLLFHTAKVLPPNRFFYLCPHKIEMHFLPPVEPGTMTADALKTKVFRMMWEYYERGIMD